MVRLSEIVEQDEVFYNPETDKAKVIAMAPPVKSGVAVSHDLNAGPAPGTVVINLGAGGGSGMGHTNPVFQEDEDEDSQSPPQNDEQAEAQNSLFLRIPTAERERKFSVRQASQFDKARRSCLIEIRVYLNAHANDEGGGRSIRQVEVFVKLFSTKELLDKLFRLFDYYQEGKLNQDKWIESLKSALSSDGGDAQVGNGSTGRNAAASREFVEVIESVAYAVCGDSDVSFDQFCKIFRTKNVLNKLYQLIDKDSDGVVNAEEIMDFISQLRGAVSGSRLTRENIAWLENLFRQYVGEEKEINKEDFSKIIQTKNQFFTDRVFDIFDGDASGSISLQEFLDATHKFAGENPEDKILFLFKVYDVDGDGLIQETELEQVMRACMEENGMRFTDEQIHELTKALFEDADVEGRGALTYNALKAQLERHSGLLENLSISIERWLMPPKPTSEAKHEVSFTHKLRSLIPHEVSQHYIRNNYVYVLWLIGFYIANICLFVTRAVVYRRDHLKATYYLVFARAAGQCLNFNCAFIVLCVLRHSLTFLRSHRASSFIPIDHHIYFHKKTGQLIFVFGVIHSVLHLINIEMGFVKGPINSRNYSYVDFLFAPEATEKWGLVSGCAMYTGLVLTLILFVMVVCSLQFVRGGGRFEVFYWTHLLYIPFWILLILHAPLFWIWFLIPGILFVLEQAFRISYWRVGKGRSHVTAGILLPSKVTHLIIKRPANFDFNPGDYVFIRIPKIAKYEWHPFTISSGPEQEDALWLHIRAVGEWTNRLHGYFEEQSKFYETVVENRKPDTFFKMPGRNRRTIMKRRVEVTHNAPHHNLIERKVSTILSNNDTTMRAQLMSVPDSDTTLSPESSEHSPPTDRSAPELSSSGETITNNNHLEHGNGSQSQKISSKELESQSEYERERERERFFSTNSMPDVETRSRDREQKMYFRQVFRSISARDDQPNANASADTDARSHFRSRPGSKSSNYGQNSFKVKAGTGKDYDSSDNSTQSSVSALLSMRYMPNVVSLKVPKREEDVESKEQLLRGGRSSRNRANSTPSAKVTFQHQRTRALHGSIGESSSEGNSNSGNLKEEAFYMEGDLEGPAGGGSEVEASASTTSSSSSDQILEIFVDGPYGAPSSHIFRAQHAVLIATGIGVTPFASILQSIMRRYWASRNTCPNCTFTWCSELPQSVLNLRKVDFFWINRDQRSFEWFVHLLSQLEIEQAELGGAMERFLDMHMYITSALHRWHFKAVGLQLALELLHEKEKRDLITGLKTRTNAGRPNWDKVFQQLKDQRKGNVTVFYCGPPELARTLRRKCDEFGFEFRKELF